MMQHKRVNIFPRGAITTVTPPIRTPIHKVTKKISDIRMAILAGARVEEILNDGSALLLNINNYDKDNNINIIKYNNNEKIVVEATSSALPSESIREVKETPSMNENVKKTEPKSLQMDNQVLASELVEDKKDDNKETKQDNQKEYLSRKQRRALEAEQRRKEQEEVTKIEEEIIEVKNPEDGNV